MHDTLGVSEQAIPGIDPKAKYDEPPGTDYYIIQESIAPDKHSVKQSTAEDNNDTDQDKGYFMIHALL